MLSGNYVKYTTIVDKAMRRLRIKEINNEDALEWLSDFMDHAKVPKTLVNKIAYLDVRDARAELPSDMGLVYQVAFVDCVDNVADAECGKGVNRPMRWATDTFHLKYHCDDSPDFEQDGRFTYTINAGFLFPNFSSGVICLSYFAIPTDEDGYPIIPGDEQWRKAAMYYIAYAWAEGAWLADELSEAKFRHLEREKDWYFAQAVNYTKVSMSLDQMESFKNDNLRTIPVNNQHNNFYRNMQLPEKRVFRRQAGFAAQQSNVISTTSKDIQIITGGENNPAP